MFYGGWEGHHPEKIVRVFSKALESHGFEIRLENSLQFLEDPAELRKFHLVFPCWTMGALSENQSKNLTDAVAGGVGLGGIHGGMGDAFRGDITYEWMVGGHFVGHPHVGDYVVSILDFSNPVTRGLPPSFPYHSEQYYMLVDPGVQVLAVTQYLHEGRSCTMPVAWIKTWGRGRVFYSSLGHDPDEFTRCPEALRLTVQGLLWAGGAE